MDYKATFDDGSELYFLQHFGIKGQKWGVRRYQNPDGSLTAEGRKRYMDKYVNYVSDDGSEIKYAYRLSKKGSRAMAEFEKNNKGHDYTAIEWQNYKNPNFVRKNKSGKAPTTREMYDALLEREAELFDSGRMFTNEYLATLAARESAGNALRFESWKDEAAWRYKNKRPTIADIADLGKFTEKDFGRKKFRHEK